MECMKNFRNAYDIIGEIYERKNSLGGLRHKGQDFESIRGLDPSGSESVLGERPSENIIYPIIPEKV